MNKEDVVCIYNGRWLSHKNRWNLAIQQHGWTLRVLNLSKKDKYYMILFTCGIWKTNNKEINEQSKLNKNKNIPMENRIVVTRGEGVGRVMEEKTVIWTVSEETRLLVGSTLLCIQNLKYNVAHMKRKNIINQCYLNTFKKNLIHTCPSFFLLWLLGETNCSKVPTEQCCYYSQWHDSLEPVCIETV